MKKCRFCAEEIQDEAIKCRFCGEFVDGTTLSKGLAPGDTIDGFTIVRELGRGGMAIVFLAEDTRLGRQVALKVLPPELMHDEQLCSRFQKEARLAASLTHQNIVPIYSVGQSANGQPYFAMAYLKGGSLSQRIKAGPMAVSESVDIVSEILAGLGYAHENAIIHRDIKPDNILFSDKNLPVIADFGIAGAASGGPALTATGISLGTPLYMSPEQFKGHKADARSDLYAVGALLYQSLTGQPPFNRNDLAGLMFDHLSTPPAPPVELRSNIPVWLNDVVLTALAKEPETRYQSADEFRRALRQNVPEITQPLPVLATQPIELPPMVASVWESSPAMPSATPVMPAPPLPASPPLPPRMRMSLATPVPEVPAIPLPADRSASAASSASLPQTANPATSAASESSEYNAQPALAPVLGWILIIGSLAGYVAFAWSIGG